MRRLVLWTGTMGSAASMLWGQAFASENSLSADQFQVTLTEELDSTLALGPSCEGEAALTVTCQVFTVTLKNVSSKTVEIRDICYAAGLTISDPQGGCAGALLAKNLRQPPADGCARGRRENSAHLPADGTRSQGIGVQARAPFPSCAMGTERLHGAKRSI